MDDTLKDALDAARYGKTQAGEKVFGISLNTDACMEEEPEHPSDCIAFADTLAEDDSDLEISQDRWGRMIVRRNGKVTYYEGKDK